MYHFLPGAALGTTVLGTKLAAGGHGAAADAARAMLPVTGIAFGLYLAVAVGLLVTGVFLRLTGARSGKA